MSSKFVAKAVAGAIALALAGTAAAASFNTDDLYLNIVDYTVTAGVESSTSYVADLGVSLSSFNPDQSYSFNLNDDTTNFSGSVYAGVGLGSGTLGFSVVGGNNTGTGATKYTIYTTANQPASSWEADTVSKTNEGEAYTPLSNFLTAIGTPTNTFATGGSTVASEQLSSANTWGQGAYEGGWSNYGVNDVIPPWGDIAAPGTALDFYTFSGNSGVATELGSWSLSAGILTYTPLSAVPLPAPLLLLLSGLGLMGLVARRGKGLGGGFGAAA